MPDDVTTTPVTTDAPPAPPVETPPAAPPVDELPADLGDAGKRAIDRMKAERDAAVAAAKVNADAATKLAEIEAASLTEAQRLEARATTAEAALLEANKLTVALEHKLPADLAARLVGTTREELVADAARLAALFPATPVPTPPPADVDQGARGNGTGGKAQVTREELSRMTDEQRVKAHDEGRLANVLAGK